MDLPGSLFDFSWRLGDYVGAPAGLGGSQVKIEKTGSSLCLYVSDRPRLGKPSRAGAAASRPATRRRHVKASLHCRALHSSNSGLGATDCGLRLRGLLGYHISIRFVQAAYSNEPFSVECRLYIPDDQITKARCCSSPSLLVAARANFEVG